jgi:maltose alpha-D-glucosyltransferase / alpha-amylase
MPRDEMLSDDPFWYRDAIIYQLHIKAFYDADGNGIGDFRGLIEKLDYLHELGVTAIWLLPFYPSPLRDDGYDTADYRNVHPQYGTLKDFREFLRAAHRRGLRVITELVINHTSDQHPWFQRARRAKPGSAHRDFYVWSDTPEKYQDARIIFQDFESSNWSWDPVAKAYFWHRFYSHQPDLNFDNPQVQKEVLRALDFWFEMGIDGLRLDAIPYLYEREGTNCENLPETHVFLKKLRAHVDRKFKNRMFLAEANQWPEDAVAYFGDGDECHTAFHFPIMPRMYMALMMEDRFPVTDILDQTPDIPENCQWAMFLRNHDELTLEMVTDEERDYMYRVYATDPRARINLGIRRRLAPLLLNNRRRIELMNILLFSLPGTPIIYYGDEIGMGDNYYLGDRDGVRTPMQWSPDRNAGFSKVNPQKLFLPVIADPEYHYEAINVENLQRNPSSLLWWMRRVIAMRKRFIAFGRGRLEMLYPDNPKVLAFIRQHEDEVLLIVVNLSRFAQVTHLDLSRYAGMFPEEVFSRNHYPLIRESPYLITLGVHDYYWFQLRPERRESLVPPLEMPKITLRKGKNWSELFSGEAGQRLYEHVLPGYLGRARWFRSKARQVRQIKPLDVIEIPGGRRGYRFVLLQVLYSEGDREIYSLPFAFLPAEVSESLLEHTPQALIAPVLLGEEEGVLIDAVYDDGFHQALLKTIGARRRMRGESGELSAFPGAAFRKRGRGSDSLLTQVVKADQTNSSIVYGDRFFLKLYRGVDEGINPDLEITRFITERSRFEHVPSFAGALEYRSSGGTPIILGLLQDYVQNQGDAWQFTHDALGRFMERLLISRDELPPLPRRIPFYLEADTAELDPEIREYLGHFYLEMIALLGRRTAQMHLALAAEVQDPVWRPDEFSTLYQRSVYQSMRSLTRRVFMQLRQNREKFEPVLLQRVERVLSSEQEVLSRMAHIMGPRLSALKIRIHGDYHLGQVLFTGKDFIIIDFEGEPARTLSERRLKRSPLRDVAGMLRSFHYAAQTALRREPGSHPGETLQFGPWLEMWQSYIGGVFLRSYIEALGTSPIVPGNATDLATMLRAFLLEKAVYEIGYELNNRPDWLDIPLAGVEMLLGSSQNPESRSQ